MTDTATTDSRVATLIDTYFTMWRATDDETRAALIDQVFTEDGRHVDPLADAIGRNELAGMLANVHTHYPGFTIERTSGIDQHGDQVRFAWRFNAADGSPIVTGVDVGEVAQDASGVRLARIAGFWGDLPPA